MRKIVVSEMISLDGYFADSKGNIDWHIVEKEFNKHAINLLKNIDTILFGRVTYDLFENYWPNAAKDPKTSASDLEIAQRINDTQKIVFSKTMEKADWNNVQLEKEITREKITALKYKPGKDIVVYGSGTVVQKLTELELVDEFRLFIAPVYLGKGKSLLNNLKNPLKLKIATSEKLGSGVVMLCYERSQEV